MQEMRNIWKAVDGLKPALLMMSVQIAFASVNVMYKVAINHGMSVRVLTAYRLIFGSACTIPLALLLERFEKLNLGKATGTAKVLGTIIGVGGAMMLTFMKGIEINIWTFHIHLLRHNAATSQQHGSKLFGVFCGIASIFIFSLWLIIQAKMSKEYPKHHSSAALMSTMGAIPATLFALSIDRDWSQWKLHWNVRLLTAVYSGVLASGIVLIVIAWCVRMRGPLYVSAFSPLILVLVGIAGSLMLDEHLYLAGVIGAMLIVVGLYMVLWGKSKEAKMNQLEPSDKTSQQSTAVEIVIPHASSLSKTDDLHRHDEQPVDDSQSNKTRDDRNTLSL